MNLDLLLLVVYLIVVTYIISQAITSLSDQTKVATVGKHLEEQLEAKKIDGKPLKDLVGISFRFEDRYKFDQQPKTLTITVENKSTDYYLYVDWDSSSLTTYDPNQSRRVIRIAPDQRISDVGLPQVFSAIPPKLKLQASITSEATLKWNATEQVMAINEPIINLDLLKTVAKKVTTPQFIKDIDFNFRERRKPIEFYLRLLLRITDVTQEEGDDRLQQITTLYGKGNYQTLLTCKFTVTKMAWVDQIPWNPQK
ncbi:MAG: hypothetical protein MUF49_08170 [Oculatellaceae cyanobacterium Prado106]|jgi:hypothetical protein|nr:hypothetical protein [Oculatellaceae cyanobacterium Prado106]